MTTLLDRYLLVQPLGRGGAATCWLARDLLSQTDVALKLLNTNSAELLAALRLEFGLLRSLSHPHIVRVRDFAPLLDSSASCFLTTDLVAGSTLDEFAAQHPWPALRQPLLDLLDALRWLHAKSIRHGDVKPANVLVRPDGRATLIDLGCARPFSAAPSSSICGTPGFLAPELLASGAADQRADIFAFGVLLNQVAPQPQLLPPAIQSILPRLTLSDPSARPGSIDEILEAFGHEPAAVPPLLSRPGRLFGRDDLLQQARSAFDLLARSVPGPRVVHIAGPDGFGRSALLQELRWDAQSALRAVEAGPPSPGSVGRLLSTALRSELPSQDVDGVLAAIDQLRAAASALVLLVDDGHKLDDQQTAMLLALCRSLRSDDPVLVVVASDSGLGLDVSHGIVLKPAPLSEREIAGWIGDALSPRAAQALHHETGGVPGPLVSLLREMEQGRLDEPLLLSGAAIAELGRRRSSAIKSLDPPSQRALAALAVFASPLSAAHLEAWKLEARALDNLVTLGFAVRSSASWSLARAAESTRLCESLPRELVLQAHRQLAAWHAARATGPTPSAAACSAHAAREVFHLAHAACVDDACDKLLRRTDTHGDAAREWLRAASVLIDFTTSPRVELAYAALLRRTGQARRAIDALRSIPLAVAPPELGAALRWELASCQLEAGSIPDALSTLAVPPDLSGPWAARLGVLLARTLVRAGDYGRAVDEVNRVLPIISDDPTRVDALVSSGVALSFLDRTQDAVARLDEAIRLLGAVPEPRLRVRAHGSRGLVAFNAGALDDATRFYASALTEAQDSGLHDQVATAALNLGTACHQAGRWGEAARAYERGLRIAVALGQTSTEAVLRFDLARLHTDIGQFDRAEALLPRAEEIALRAGTKLALAELLTIRAELAQWRSDLGRARELLRQAAVTFHEQHSVRETAEVELHLADVCIAAGLHDDAQRHIDSAKAAFRSDAPPDLRLRVALVQASLLIARREQSAALAVLEPALRATPPTLIPDVQARSHLVLATVWDSQGSSVLAERHRTLACEIWERTAALLPEHVREAFWRHPARRDARPAAAQPAAPHDQRVELLLDINKRLNSTLDTTEILRRTMDAALSLTGAERGFVLLRSGRRDAQDKLRVAVARNLDREHVDQAQLKFSRAIAERVVASASPVTTAEAHADARFALAASVHAMHLASVVCVPVISPAGVMGALYLDHRFHRGRFTDDDVHVLQAFADQVAIALTNARLHRDLAERTRELEERNRRIEQLMQSQAAQIEALQEQVRTTASPARRYDYRSIVGSSAAMQRVLAVLDRVIDTELPVLIAGESGTGKELVARAIHANSPRAKGPLISINCGAVPEQLLESELFGHERGAFTGADRKRDGLMVRASGGTLFLDELGELPLAMQVKLLRVLQEREVLPLGAHRPQLVDFRLVCATNKRLREEMARGSFREDLFYRVSAIELILPPLRDRLEDVPALAARILDRSARDANRPIPQLSRAALAKLMSAPWPGNVRQLENVLLKAAVLCDAGKITAKDIDLPSAEAISLPAVSRAAWQQVERERIEKALVEHRWNVARVARQLGIPRPTLYRKLAKYSLHAPLGRERDDDSA